MSTSKATIYTLRVINPDVWSKVRKYDFSSEYIGPALNNQGLPVTGLTEDAMIPNGKGQTEKVKGTRTQLEEEMGLPEGHLKQRSDFWILYNVMVGVEDEVFDITIPEDRLKVLFLKAQPEIADGIDNIKAKSRYILFTEEEAVKHTNDRGKLKRKANDIYAKLTGADKCEILEMLNIKAASLDADSVDAKLYDYLEEQPGKFILLAEDPTRGKQSFVRKCLERGIMSIENGSVMYGETVVGIDIESAAIALHSDEMKATMEAVKILLKK